MDLSDYAKSIETETTIKIGDLKLNTKLIYVDAILLGIVDSDNTLGRYKGYAAWNQRPASHYFFPAIPLLLDGNSGNALSQLTLSSPYFTYASDTTITLSRRFNILLGDGSYNSDVVKQGHIWIGDPPTNLTN